LGIVSNKNCRRDAGATKALNPFSEYLLATSRRKFAERDAVG
jgi:hypothetical protein